MSETSTVPALLDDPAYALALDAGHTAAAAGHWLAAATRFGDALRAATPAGGGLPPLAPVCAAVALSNLGQALARAGCWADAAEMLRRSAEARDALVAEGLADDAVAARGWSDLAALLAAAGPENEARAALARALAATPSIDDPAVLAALAETRMLLGAALAETRMLLGAAPAVDGTLVAAPFAPIGAVAHDDDDLGFALPPAASAPTIAHARETAPTLDTLDLADAFDAVPMTDAPSDPAPPATCIDGPALDLAPRTVQDFTLDLELAEVGAPAAAPADAEADGDDAPDLAALLALAAGPPEPELEPLELDDDDSLTDALDAAVLSMPDDAIEVHAAAAAPVASGTPPAPAALAGLELMSMDDEDAPFPASTPVSTAERAAPSKVSQIVFDELDADPYGEEPVLLTPGVDFAQPRDARPSAQGGGRGARLAAVDAVVQLTEAASPPARAGGLRGFLRRLLGR